MQLPATAQFPLCKSCRFFSPAEGVSAEPKCAHDSALMLDYVHGNHTRYSCTSHRRWRTGCGPDGKFFEPATHAQAVETPADVIAVVRFNGGEAA